MFQDGSGEHPKRKRRRLEWPYRPRTPGSSSLPGTGGVTRATHTRLEPPESLTQRAGRSRLAPPCGGVELHLTFILPKMKRPSEGGRDYRGPRAPLTRASAEAPSVSVPGLRPLTSRRLLRRVATSKLGPEVHPATAAALDPGRPVHPTRTGARLAARPAAGSIRHPPGGRQRGRG